MCCCNITLAPVNPFLNRINSFKKLRNRNIQLAKRLTVIVFFTVICYKLSKNWEDLDISASIFIFESQQSKNKEKREMSEIPRLDWELQRHENKVRNEMAGRKLVCWVSLIKEGKWSNCVG